MKFFTCYHGTDAQPFNRVKASPEKPCWFTTDFATAATYGRNVAEVFILVDDEKVYHLPLDRFERPGHLSDIVSSRKHVAYTKYYVETTGGKKICIGSKVANSNNIVFEQWFKDYARIVLKDYNKEPFSQEDFIHTGKNQSYWVGLVCRKLSDYRVLGDTLKYYQMSDYTSLIWHTKEDVCVDVCPTHSVAMIEASITALYLPLSSMAMGFDYTDDYAQDGRRLRYQANVRKGVTLVVNDSKLVSNPIWHTAY